MKTNVNHSPDQPWPHPAATHDLDKQRLCILRILRCTAKAMASGPGGLRFKAGTRPWLDGLAGGQPALSTGSGQSGNPSSQAANG
jgi:hypothetical protein